MDVLSSEYYESVKRYWRRRRYRRLSSGAKKLKIRRLGGKGQRARPWNMRLFPKFRFSMVSPVKLLVKFHDAYIDVMIRLVGNAGNSAHICLFGGNMIPKGPSVSTVSSYEKVDSRLVLEISKRSAASSPVLSAL